MYLEKKSGMKQNILDSKLIRLLQKHFFFKFSFEEKHFFASLHPQKHIDLRIKEKHFLEAQVSKAIFPLFSNSLAVPDIPLHSLEKSTDRKPNF